MMGFMGKGRAEAGGGKGLSGGKGLAGGRPAGSGGFMRQRSGGSPGSPTGGP